MAGFPGATPALLSATTVVNVSAATAPSANQVLTASSSTAASWVTPTSSALSSKVTNTTKDLTQATGDVAYTGVGFVPTSVHVTYFTSGLTTGAGNGYADSAKTNTCRYISSAGNNTLQAAKFIYYEPSGGGAQDAIVKTYDADGFTLTWTKGGSPTGTGTLIFCFYK